ncbi:MAG: hypothetical protein KGH58_04680 [Candidatus Micrarchaeota archaeon]|nr:hypothetical protein [Candidatus Micrarchaeota archaeon]
MADRYLEAPKSRMIESLERLCHAGGRETDVRYYFGEQAQGDATSLSSAIASITRLVRGRASHYGDALAGVFASTMATNEVEKPGDRPMRLFTLPVSELYYDRTCIVHIFCIIHTRGQRKYGYAYDASYNERLGDRRDMANLYRLGVPLRAMDEVLLADRLRR